MADDGATGHPLMMGRPPDEAPTNKEVQDSRRRLADQGLARIPFMGLINWGLSPVAPLSARSGDVGLMAVAPDRPLGQIEYSLVLY